jgi:hypothetical protein
MGTNDYLTEFRILAQELTKVVIKNFEGSDLSPEEYINSIQSDFGKDLSEKASDVLPLSRICNPALSIAVCAIWKYKIKPLYLSCITNKNA